MTTRTLTIALAAVALSIAASRPASAVEGRWKRTISYQDQNDQFYNFFEGPEPSGAAAAMYVSPRPVPPQVGHTYVPYQPFMPHEYLYHHKRTYYTHNACGGWTRTKVRYGTQGLWLDHIIHNLACPFCD